MYCCDCDASFDTYCDASNASFDTYCDASDASFDNDEISLLTSFSAELNSLSSPLKAPGHKGTGTLPFPFFP